MPLYSASVKLSFTDNVVKEHWKLVFISIGRGHLTNWHLILQLIDAVTSKRASRRCGLFCIYLPNHRNLHANPSRDWYLIDIGVKTDCRITYQVSLKARIVCWVLQSNHLCCFHLQLPNGRDKISLGLAFQSGVCEPYIKTLVMGHLRALFTFNRGILHQ